MRGELVPTRDLLRGSAANPAYALGVGVANAPCGDLVYSHNGGGSAWASSVNVSKDGKRVAVLLLNGRGDSTKDAAYPSAALDLFCKS